MKKYFLMMVLVFPLLAYAAIYKTVDSNGNVSFTDAPQQGSQEVTLPEPQNYQPPQTPPSQSQLPAAQAPETDYTVKITTPADQATIHSNEGIVNVIVDLQPDLKNGDRLWLLMDGKKVSESSTVTVFSLKNVFRGQHQLEAQVVSATGEILKESQTITFFVFHTSIQNPHPSNNPKPQVQS